MKEGAERRVLQSYDEKRGVAQRYTRMEHSYEGQTRTNE